MHSIYAGTRITVRVTILEVVVIVQFNINLFCVFFSDLRLDTLSQILTMSNVRAHCRVMVVESCQGMVVGALLERMGGKHNILRYLYTA